VEDVLDLPNRILAMAEGIGEEELLSTLRGLRKRRKNQNPQQKPRKKRRLILVRVGHLGDMQERP
jgi:hypothetical protein